MSKKRFIASVIKTAKTDAPALPWQRGSHRAAMIAVRRAPVANKLRTA